jgi:hypothetical protein
MRLDAHESHLGKQKTDKVFSGTERNRSKIGKGRKVNQFAVILLHVSQFRSSFKGHFFEVTYRATATFRSRSSLIRFPSKEEETASYFLLL